VAVIEAVPAAAIKAAGTVAVARVDEETPVVSAVPFQLTTAPEPKLEPETDSVKAAPPAMAVSGKIDEMVT
jgi:hypothetical protein